MESLGVVPLSGTALPGQDVLLESLWNDFTPLDSNASLTGVLTAIRSTVSRNAVTSELKSRFTSSSQLVQASEMVEIVSSSASIGTSGTVLNGQSFFTQPTMIRSATISDPAHGAAASDSLTGIAESAPLVSPSATAQDIMINFQPDTADVPAGYVKDVGKAYSETRGFGWVRQDSLSSATHTPLDITSNARDRDRAGINQRQDTLLHMQYPASIANSAAEEVPAAWEYALPNGTYNVKVSVGDQSFQDGVYDSQHTINVEGISTIDRFQSSSTQEYKRATVQVIVTDGKLTVDAIGGINTKLNHVEIESVTTPPAQSLATPYTDPSQLTKVPFGYQSHWLQPWRAYMETVPATTFLNGTGVQWANSENPELIAQMLARHGIRHARIEIGWNNISYTNETELAPHKAAYLQAQLLAMKKYGIRPLILLNANHGVPGPENNFSRTLTVDAHAGDTTVQLNDVSGLKIGYSGLSNLTDYWAAEALITGISGNTITLSKPLPKDITAGTSVPMATLKYRPFSPPDSNDYRVTVAGWQQYVDTVAKFAARVLGTTQSSGKGFDMEIWNELTFGSNFLSINNYYAQEPYNYNENSIWSNLVKETAAHVDAHATAFQGVLLSDGFANTQPWTASSQEPARIDAISKHPYATKRQNYPQDNRGSIPINALGQEDKSGFSPTYSALFPEYYGTAIQTETLIRDMAPITSEIYGVRHGRNARTVNGQVAPVPVWITEVNVNPIEADPNITVERALAVKAKTTARYFSFYLNKGATQVDLYSAAGGDKEWGIVKQSFLDYAAQPNAIYPKNDTPYTSPALTALSRIFRKMSQQLNPNLKKTDPLQVVSISDTHNHYQFKGDGTAAHPTLYNRDVFAFLPFQVNARRFVIPYYVMTRDVMKDLAPEQFTLQLKGVKGSGASVTAYDPIKGRAVPVVINSGGSDSLSVKLAATDYPYLLTIQERA